MKSRIILFGIALLVWLGLTWSLHWQYLLIGLLASLIVAWVTGDLFTQNPYKFKHHTRYMYFIYYLPIFFWEMFKANLDVAWRVIHPKRPINPGIVKVKTNLKSETGITFLANSITLTPGTLSVEADPEKGYIYVHWIDVKTQDTEQATKKIVDKFEKILGKIFEA